MTNKELSQLYYLNREIEGDKKRLAELEAASAGAAAPLTGLPRAPGVGNPTERLAVEIADLKAIILAKQIQCIHERARLERYIAAIEDSETRWVLTLRFVSGLPWAQVAAHLGDGHTADRVKKVCYRYLNKPDDTKEE